MVKFWLLKLPINSVAFVSAELYHTNEVLLFKYKGFGKFGFRLFRRIDKLWSFSNYRKKNIK